MQGHSQNQRGWRARPPLRGAHGRWARSLMALLHSLLDSFYGPCRYITVLGDSLTRRDSWKQSAAQGDTGWPEEALPAGLRVEDSLLCVPLASQRLRRGTLSLISLLHTIQISPMPSCCWGFPVPLKPRSSCKTPTTVSQDREGVLGHFREMLGVGQRNGWHTTPDTAETFIGLLRPCSVLQPPGHTSHSAAIFL